MTGPDSEPTAPLTRPCWNLLRRREREAALCRAARRPQAANIQSRRTCVIPFYGPVHRFCPPFRINIWISSLFEHDTTSSWRRLKHSRKNLPNFWVSEKQASTKQRFVFCENLIKSRHRHHRIHLRSSFTRIRKAKRAEDNRSLRTSCHPALALHFKIGCLWPMSSSSPVERDEVNKQGAVEISS